MKNKPSMSNEEQAIYLKAEQFVRKSKILREQSSACRRAWCEGFVNGKKYYDHLKPKGKWYEFWKR